LWRVWTMLCSLLKTWLWLWRVWTMVIIEDLTEN
jgi:hypothetical protein